MSDRDHQAELMASAAAWVLGALPAQEAAAFERELRDSAELRDEVARLGPVADLLALAAPAAEPPAALQGRIMDVVRREADLLAATGADADRVPAAAKPPRAGVLGRIFSRRPLTAALAVGALAIGVGIGVAVSTGGPDTTTRPITSVVAGADVTGELIEHDDNAEIELHAPAPPAGKVYQAWVMRDGKISRDAVFTVDGAGRGSVSLDNDVSGAQQVLVSVEPDGGSPQPTSAPIAAASLS